MGQGTDTDDEDYEEHRIGWTAFPADSCLHVPQIASGGIVDKARVVKTRPYTCVYVSVNKHYIYICRHIPLYIHGRVYTCVYVHMYMYIDIYICIIEVYGCIYMYIDVHVYIYRCKYRYGYVYIYMHIHMFIISCAHM